MRRAAEHSLALQGADGSWKVLPDARILETALGAYALAHTPGDLDREAVARARAWVAAAQPQRHHRVAFLVEDILRRIVLRSGGAIDLTAPEFGEPALSSRRTLLHALALHAGLEVRAPYGEAELRRRVADEYERCSQAKLKQWSKAELIALHILLQARAGNEAAVEAAKFDLVHVQSPPAGYLFNPVSASLTYLALCVAAPTSDPWFVLRARLLEDQQPDGTWRFCTSDVWDTSLMVRAFREHPYFAQTALQPALDFLQAAQNPDGGWPFRLGVESDNDTTGCVLLALRGTMQGERTVDRALAYLARVRMDNGLWRTWQFRDDPPVEDVVAHVLSALDAYTGRHRIGTEPARQWLAEQIAQRGAWTASWYRGVPYAVAEISRALGSNHPLAQRGIDALAAAQREDGGWGAEVGGESTASATGLALMAIARRHPARIQRAVQYLVETQREDGTWPGTPDMYGPRPLLSHFLTHTQAFVVGGLMAVRDLDWTAPGRSQGEGGL
ncbi:MAG TPA: prenyltransferase/squalene oxidase repeat-containing protein [Nannocystis sp.]